MFLAGRANCFSICDDQNPHQHPSCGRRVSIRDSTILYMRREFYMSVIVERVPAFLFVRTRGVMNIEHLVKGTQLIVSMFTLRLTFLNFSVRKCGLDITHITAVALCHLTAISGSENVMLQERGVVSNSDIRIGCKAVDVWRRVILSMDVLGL